ncbi:hypothetical protein CBER1_09816 [Cercospora berteroae]|uniref:Uncharacterized protein n=1 Tax=Cercospora berteroae TaxID=357750 RepID=A0A2S6BX45_9PEZI|nr:hypothetical protein CBER1_09816 [Cercospora berteroae]
MCGHAKITQALIDHGADVNTFDNLGKKPLYWAADGGHTETLWILMHAQGERMEFQPNDSQSLMAYLKAIGQFEIVELFEAAVARSMPKAASSNPPRSQADPQSGRADFMDTNVDASGESKTKTMGSKKAKQGSRLENHQSEDW